MIGARAERWRRPLGRTTRASASRRACTGSWSAAPAIERPELVDELAERTPATVAVGLDARGRDVAIHGWTDDDRASTSSSLRERFDAIPGVGALVVTGIDRDGMLGGPDVDQLTRGARRGRRRR